MRKLITLAILLLFLVSLLLSCAKQPDENPEKPSEGNQNNGGSEPQEPSAPTITVPEYKDYGRGTVNYNDIIYERPSVIALVASYTELTEKIENGSLSANEIISALKALEEPHNSVISMYAIAEINHYKDTSLEFWQTEHEYLSTSYPSFTQAVEDLLVKCARSPFKATLESEYFGYSLDEYTEGGIYTDEAVKLLQKEAELEAEYSGLSTANVTIVYPELNGFSANGTVDDVYKAAAAKFGIGTKGYNDAVLMINSLYQSALENAQKPIYVDLIKVRRLIADELGYGTYTEYAYEAHGYEYTERQMLSMLSDVAKYISPVARQLENSVFQAYFPTNRQPALDRVSMINTLLDVYKATDSTLYDIYCYMLQHGLYDINEKSDNRFNGAFTAYIKSNNSPYLFMSSSGFISDYLVLSHEFGHFADGYINYGASPALHISEISSQSLEFLTLLSLENKLSVNEYTYLKLYSMRSILNNIFATQSCYAMFEHIAYRLEYDEINEKSLNEAVNDAVKYIFGSEINTTADFTDMMIPHTVLHPLYVESYVSSGLVSLDIFFNECEMTGTPGTGYAQYKSLIERSEKDITLTELLEKSKLDSPFEQDKVKKIANNIHYFLVGSYYFKECTDEVGAA